MKISSEPVAIPGAIMAVVVAGFGLAVLLGLPLTPEQVGGFVTFAGALIALVTAIQRQQSVPKGDVVERTKDGKVLAGDANAIPTGSEIRDLSDAPAYEPQRAATPIDNDMS